jgi:hypothetical protein
VTSQPDLHVEVAKIVVHEENYMTGAEVNNVQEPVKTDMWNKIVSSERDPMCSKVKTKFKKQFSLQEAKRAWNNESETLESTHTELKFNYEEYKGEQIQGMMNTWVLRGLRDWTVWKIRPPPKRRKENWKLPISCTYMCILVVKGYICIRDCM